MNRALFTLQEFTEAADGENVLVVTHMDAVNASVSRYKPWALVYPVKHTGYTVSYREKYDGASDPKINSITVRICS